MNRLRYLLPLLLLLVLLAAPGASSAQVKSFYWERVDVDITLQENGDLLVNEQQTLVFTGDDFSFGYRTIPTGVSGGNDGIEDIRVTEGNTVYELSASSAPYTYWTEREGDEIKVNWYFPPTQGRHTYNFSYRVKGGVRVGNGEPDSGDQIFWMAIPADHPARIENSTVTIHLPEGIRPQVFTGTDNPLVAAYIDGQPTEAVSITVSDDSRTIRYDLPGGLATGETLEVRVQFPPGLLGIGIPDWQRQEQMADVWRLLLLVAGLLILVGGPLMVLLLWYLRGRDPEVGPVADYLPEPPSPLPPAVAGTLVDEKADLQDIIATLLDLARRGHLSMEETQDDHRFTLLDKNDDDLRPYEVQFLKAFFKGKQSRTLTSLKYKFAQNMGTIQNALYDEMVREKLFDHSPETVRNLYRIAAVGLIVLGGVIFFAGTAILGESALGLALCPALAIGVTAIILMVVAGHMPAKTRQGAEVAARWRAFKTYLEDIEKYTRLEEAVDIFEKYLPYAVAFGLERSWIRKFAAVPSTPMPTWYAPYPYHMGGNYHGRGRSSQGGPSGSGSRPSLEGMSGGLTGGLAAMSTSLTGMLNSTSSVLRSTPPSSSSSGGFSSGGFSGGGSSGGGSMGFG